MDDVDKNNLYAAWLDLYKAALVGVAARVGLYASDVAEEARKIADEALRVAAAKAERQQKEFSNV